MSALSCAVVRLGAANASAFRPGRTTLRPRGHAQPPLVGTFGGWGFRLVFVPDDEIHDQPDTQVKEPADA